MNLSDLDEFAKVLMQKARFVDSSSQADEISLQLDVFNSVARYMAIRNKINPDEFREGSIIDGYKKEIKSNNTGGNGSIGVSGATPDSATTARKKGRPRPATFDGPSNFAASKTASIGFSSDS